MKKKVFITVSALFLFAFTVNSCIEHNKNSNNDPQNGQESDYRNDPPTYNRTREDMEEALDTASSDKRIPKDSVEINSKGNASSQ